MRYILMLNNVQIVLLIVSFVLSCCGALITSQSYEKMRATSTFLESFSKKVGGNKIHQLVNSQIYYLELISYSRMRKRLLSLTPNYARTRLIFSKRRQFCRYFIQQREQETYVLYSFILVDLT